ncbi:leucine-rich repeat-containing protein 40-like [Tubulanus polymorphus]|uniref:leucine-rich repeat-containing protein 40-like n=1 Tax=Tubulanus polymorphus TaxID=672921 RepID=UPI003DA5FDD7
MATRRGRGALRPGFKSSGSAVFGQQGTDKVHDAILKQARKSGQLNLSGRGLSEVPASVWKINQELPEESRNVNLDNADERWWEQVDLTKLILASNSISHLHEDIINLPALIVLDVHDNSLVSLPENLAKLKELSRLILSHNKLSKIPSCLYSLDKLTTLHLAHNEITELGEDIGQLLFIEDLDISHNKLTALPQSIGYLAKVFKFNASNNEICDLPEQIGGLNAVRILDMTHNQLTRLPESVGTLANLEQLHLRHNKLTYLPLLKGCHKLKDLQVGNNGIKEIRPEQMEHLYSLSVLDIRDNKISVLPEEITILQALERLDLTNNDLSCLPFSLGTMSKLKSIVLDGNPLKAIRRDIIMRGTNELKKYLQSRIEEPVETNTTESAVIKQANGASGIIGGTGDYLDPHTIKLTGTIEYYNKKSTEIPTVVWEVMKDKQIKVINFSKNLLQKWPENLVLVGDHLQQLNLGFNRLTTVSSDVGLFINLIYLDLRNNQLHDLPEDVKQLHKLREISIAYNRLKSIPKALYGLPKLEILLASDNQIDKLDVTGIKETPVLATLDLQNNNISQVPPELGNCSQLRSLQLEGNAFRNPRPAILAKGTGPLLEWLRGRIT